MNVTASGIEAPRTDRRQGNGLGSKMGRYAGAISFLALSLAMAPLATAGHGQDAPASDKSATVRAGEVVAPGLQPTTPEPVEPTAETPLYRDASQPVDARVDDLLARMTLDEKIAQIVCIWIQKEKILNEDGSFSSEKMAEAYPHGVGCVARPQDFVGLGQPGAVEKGRDVAGTIAITNALQTHLAENTRLGIPTLFHEEGLHGYQATDTTAFPQAIALASTWNPDLVEDVYSVVAREIRARGVHHVLSPVVDVARDPRWGRIEETYGEDPNLVSRMGVAAVRGFQGDGETLADGKVLTTLKHMTGHGEPESGMNVGPANISERILREVFFPPFEAAIREAGAASVMASYNEIDGIPSHINKFLLEDVLRGEWGFDGPVVSDYFAVDELVSRHSIAETVGDAARHALVAGVDLELPDPSGFPLLKQQVENGTIDIKTIDQAVRRVLKMKIEGRVLDDYLADAKSAEALTGNDEARALALKAAQQAITLLKNDDGLLPLDKTALKKIAVIGPNAAETILGGYSGHPRQTVSLLDGVKSALGDGAEVVHAEGVRLTEGRSWWKDEIVLADRDENLTRIEEAVKAAAGADVIILALGGNESTSREGWGENHLGDRASLELIGEQQELFDALQETGIPIVTVMINGRPLAIANIAEEAPAILESWLLGQETGTALADVIFGALSPSGKLPVTIPRSTGHIPAFYNHKPTARRGFLDADASALYPFGHGLSYTTFKIGKPKLKQTSIAKDGQFTVTVSVKNTGKMPGAEVVQLYIRDVASSVTRPVKELKAFERVELAPGKSQTVSFTLNADDVLAFYDINMERVVEPGTFKIMVGSSSATTEEAELTVRQ